MSLSGQKKESTGAESSPEGDSAATKDKEEPESETEKEDTANEEKNENSEENTLDKPDEDGEADKTGDPAGKQEEEEEEEETEQSDDEQTKEETINVDLSCMKTLYQFRSRPTLPYLLTEYGMEDKGAPPMKPKHKEKKKKKRRSFGDDSGRDKEKEKQIEERQLQVLEDMKKLRDYYYDEYTALLQNRVEQQRHDIRQHSRRVQDKIARMEELARQGSHQVKRRAGRHALVSDDSFLEDLPKSDVFYITQLQDKLVKEGTLKSQTDFDIFWERIQQPDIFYMYFKVPKSDDPTLRDDFNDNASSKATSTCKGSASTLGRGSGGDRHTRNLAPARNQGGSRALSRIAESRESSRPGTRMGQHWAVTQQFPSQFREPRDKRRSSFSGLKQPLLNTKSSYLQDLEKRFPKLEMPKLHCFTLNLGPKAPDPEEVRYQLSLHTLEKNRKKYTYKLNKMHQLAMANAAAARRILEMHDDIDFIINGSPLKDLISDQHFYSGLPPPSPPQQHYMAVGGEVGGQGGPFTSSSPLPERDSGQQHMLPSLLEQEERDASSIHSYRSSRKTARGKSRGSRKYTPSKAVDEELGKPSSLPLTLSEVTDNTRIVEAKCLSTLWTNYLKDVPPAQT